MYINRYTNLGFDGLNRSDGTGKIKNTKNNDNKIQSIFAIIYSNKYLNLAEIKEKIQNEDNINISIYAIRNILFNHGFEYGYPPKRIHLTEDIKYKRLQFAIKYNKFNWNNTLFTDECSIWKNKKSMKRWFNKNLALDSDVLFKHYDKLNLWGCISHNTNKILYIFNENMNATKYISILKENFLNVYDKNKYFQYDNDPKHTSTKAKKFIADNKIKTIDFPSYSPDLNPIENIWGILKSKLEKRNEKINNDNFKYIIMEEWNTIDQSMIDNIISSMPSRLQKIIDNKGEHIDY